MPKISFCFSGWVNGANVSVVMDVASGQEVDVTDLTVNEVVERLLSGEWALSLWDGMNNCDSSEAELFDYE